MFGRVLLTLFILAWSSSALADASVVVLGLRSVEGDDDVANAITEELRAAARGVPGFQVSTAAVSMAQMSLAHGCEEIDAACLAEIARGLSADVVIYGTLRRNSARENYDFAINLSLFDARIGQIAKVVDDVLPRVPPSPEAQSELARRLIQRLTSTAAGGSITLQVNVTDAEVEINDQPVGSTRDGGLRMDGLQPGQYRIEIKKRGYTTHVSTVTVVEGGDTAITAMLVPASAADHTEPDYEDHGGRGGHRLGWLGWTLIGVGAVSVAGMAVSMAVISDIDDDPVKIKYADAVARGNEEEKAAAERAGRSPVLATDVCEQASRGFTYGLTLEERNDVADLCDTADTMYALQIGFIVTAILTTGAGIALLLTEESGEDRADAESARPRTPRFALAPTFGRDSGGIHAVLRF